MISPVLNQSFTMPKRWAKGVRKGLLPVFEGVVSGAL